MAYATIMITRTLLALLASFVLLPTARAQVPPSSAERAVYTGLHKAAAAGDVAAIEREARAGSAVDLRDGHGRTPLHVAVFAQQPDAVRALIRLGADANALEAQKYDPVTIASVANDVPMLALLLANGARATNITSPYHGTALIAAAHLGHQEVVRRLIAGGAPLDHVNNLGWTALMEAVVLGNGGPDHIATVRALVEAGADIGIPDRSGVTPLQHAEARGYGEIAGIIRAGRRN